MTQPSTEIVFEHEYEEICNVSDLRFGDIIISGRGTIIFVVNFLSPVSERLNLSDSTENNYDNYVWISALIPTMFSRYLLVRGTRRNDRSITTERSERASSDEGSERCT